MQSRVEEIPTGNQFPQIAQENLTFSSVVRSLIEEKFNKKIEDIQMSERKPKADKGV